MRYSRLRFVPDGLLLFMLFRRYITLPSGFCVGFAAFLSANV